MNTPVREANSIAIQPGKKRDRKERGVYGGAEDHNRLPCLAELLQDPLESRAPFLQDLGVRLHKPIWSDEVIAPALGQGLGRVVLLLEHRSPSHLESARLGKRSISALFTFDIRAKIKSLADVEREEGCFAIILDAMQPKIAK